MAGILKVDQVQSDSNLSFQVAGANVAYMNSTGLQMTGGQIIAGSNTLLTASGLIYANAGIAFPASQSSSADGNTLDDYEEGTWTPVLTPVTGTITSQLGNGTYIKIGRLVVVNYQVQILGGTVSVIGNLTGLPFVQNGTNNYVTSAAREWYASGNIWQVIGSVGDTQFQLVRYDNSSACGTNFAWAGTHSYITNI